MSALYGFHKLYTSDGNAEFELILKTVDSSNFPTNVWIELHEGKNLGSFVTTVCGEVKHFIERQNIENRK